MVVTCLANALLHVESVAAGSRVQRLRRARGLSQEALADRAGIHVTYLSRIENGKQNPGLTVIGRLAHALDVSLAELFRAVRPQRR